MIGSIIGAVISPMLGLGLSSYRQSQQRKLKRKLVRQRVLRPWVRDLKRRILKEGGVDEAVLLELCNEAVKDTFSIYISHKGLPWYQAALVIVFKEWLFADKREVAVDNILMPYFLEMLTVANRPYRNEKFRIKNLMPFEKDRYLKDLASQLWDVL